MPFMTCRWYRPGWWTAVGVLVAARRWRRRAMAAFGLAVGMLLVATSTSFAATAAPQQLNYLWSIPSASGSLTGRDNQHLVLRLVGVRDYLTRFTDRPVSQAYVVANADFVRRFKRYFATANPNAVLSFSKAGQRIPTQIVLRISHPRWRPKTSTLTFRAVRIVKREDDLPDTTVHVKPPVIRNPRRFEQASLFIDSAAASPVCTRSGGTAMCTFVLTGTAQDFTVPAGVTRLQVVAVGGNGGSSKTDRGGMGAKVAGTLAVTPGQVLNVIVGGNGVGSSRGNTLGMSGGFDGGGAGGTGAAGQDGGEGGGGASMLLCKSPIFCFGFLPPLSSSRAAAEAPPAPTRSLLEATRRSPEPATTPRRMGEARGPRRAAAAAAAKRSHPVVLLQTDAGCRVPLAAAGPAATGRPPRSPITASIHALKRSASAAGAAAAASGAAVVEAEAEVEAAVRAWSGPGIASSASTRPVPRRSRSAGRCRRDSSRPRLTGRPSART